jgi:uncharacterized Zn-binding protein involved in type VI secretion
VPAATRIGDADVAHCSGMTRAEGSPNVFVNGIPWSRQGDINTVHLLPGTPCPAHTAPIASGSSTVIQLLAIAIKKKRHSTDVLERCGF